VRFTARELWGEDASPRDTISLDLWEPYLERA
jgi:nitrile hydratase